MDKPQCEEQISLSRQFFGEAVLTVGHVAKGPTISLKPFHQNSSWKQYEFGQHFITIIHREWSIEPFPRKKIVDNFGRFSSYKLYPEINFLLHFIAVKEDNEFHTPIFYWNFVAFFSISLLVWLYAVVLKVPQSAYVSKVTIKAMMRKKSSSFALSLVLHNPKLVIHHLSLLQKNFSSFWSKESTDLSLIDFLS